MELEGRKVLISGGGSGIGLELAIRSGIARDRKEIRVARVKQLAFPARVAPRLADRILIRALRPAQAGSPS